MMPRMRLRRLAICLLLACLAIPATIVRADDGDIPDYDARTQGYPAGTPTHMEDTGTIGAVYLHPPGGSGAGRPLHERETLSPGLTVRGADLSRVSH